MAAAFIDASTIILQLALQNLRNQTKSGRCRVNVVVAEAVAVAAVEAGEVVEGEVGHILPCNYDALALLAASCLLTDVIY